MNHWIIGISAALGSAFSWAAGSILFKQLGKQLSSTAMTWVKSFLSSLLLVIAIALIGFESMSRYSVFLLVISGLLGITLGDTFFFKALKALEAHTVVLLLMLGQVFTVILAVLVLGERPEIQVWVGVFITLFGVWFILNEKLSEDPKDEQERNRQTRKRGIQFGLLSVFCMSVSIIIAKQALEDVNAMQATLIRMTAGTAGMFAFGMKVGRIKSWIEPFYNTRLAIHFILAVTVVTFGGFWLSLLAIKHIDVVIANSLIATEPLFVLPLAALFLKEKITKSALAGSVVITTGIIIMLAGS